MRSCAAIALITTIGFIAPAEAEQARPSSPNSRTSVELTGCVSGEPAASGTFTFVDSTSGGKYALTGKGVREYAGQMVRLVGGPQGKRLSIRGGLWPSPNIAAQAGAIDPAQAAIARQPGGTGAATGSHDLPQFRVASVRRADGTCR